MLRTLLNGEEANAEDDRSVASREECNFKYTSLANRSFDSNTLDNLDEKNKPIAVVSTSSIFDQKLPDSSDMNSSNTSKQGLLMPVTRKPCTLDASAFELTERNVNTRSASNDNDCNQQLTNAHVNMNDFKVRRVQPTGRMLMNGRLVPCVYVDDRTSSYDSTLSNLSSSSASFGDRNQQSDERRQPIGNSINGYDLASRERDMDNVDEFATHDVTYSHIKYVRVFAILCCWCFPFTGIFTIFYSFLASKYFKKKDMQRAKKYLSTSEWLLMLTFFFGITMIALGLAVIDAYLVKSNSTNSMHPDEAPRFNGASISRLLH